MAANAAMVAESFHSLNRGPPRRSVSHSASTVHSFPPPVDSYSSSVDHSTDCSRQSEKRLSSSERTCHSKTECKQRIRATIQFVPRAGARHDGACFSRSAQATSQRTSAYAPRRRQTADHQPARPTPSRDRFIPKRELTDSMVTTFRVSIHPELLTPMEKLHRQRDKRKDPFQGRRPRTVISGREYHNQQRILSTHPVPHLLDHSALSDGDGIRIGTRQISAGAVWNVGGASAAQGTRLLGVPDGAGGFCKSGSMAPLHVALFFTRPSPSEEQDMNESRLTLALDIDQAQRLLQIPERSKLHDSTPPASSPRYEMCCPLTWKDNAWKRSELIAGKWNIEPAI
ncbi:hypothetical protein VTN31DRAFT_5927 [Thermomyces dupontii]|uniref:uncharacterized protein n=1 Tax=Talaromyces thermophilus TaxID=28565 RepID=UPI00374319A0